MSTKDLKAACTRPWKLHHQIWNGRQLLEPACVRLMRPSWGAVVNTLKLVPGGRFLITVDTVRRLCLWDLGHGASSPFLPEPLAVKQFSGPSVLGMTWSLMHPTADGEGIVCCVTVITGWFNSFDQVHIVEIYPASKNPQFNTIGVHLLNEEEKYMVHCHDMTCDLFGYHAKDQLVIWDFRNDTQCRITCDKEAEKMLISNDVVLVLSRRGYTLFSVSPLTFASTAVRQIELMTSALFPFIAVELSLPLTWYISTQSDRQDVHINIIQYNDGPWRIHRYTLSTSTTESGSSSAVFLETREPYYTTYKANGNAIVSLTMSGDEHGFIWLDGQLLKLSVTRRDDDNRETKWRWLYEGEQGEFMEWDEEWAWSFCPFAARLCSLSFHGEIRIIDFVE